MKHNVAIILFIALLSSSFILQAQNKSSYHLVKTFPIAGSGGWDYIALDTGSNNLYQSHSTQVNILNKITGDSVGVIPNTTGVHGIAFIDALNKGYTSNGKINSVTVFDLKTFKVLKQISTDQGPDAILYDPFSKKIITCNGHGKDLSIIDPETDTVIATIPVNGKPEEAASDNAGKIYVNIEDKSEIAVIDIIKRTVIDRWPIAPGESPTGLAIDRATKRLFAGCDNKLLIVISATDGKIINKLSIGDGCDGVGFDSTLKYAFASCGDGTLTVIDTKHNCNVIDVIITKKGARTITVDSKTHNIYLPTADFEPLPPNAVEKTRPKIIPGTFGILVIEK